MVTNLKNLIKKLSNKTAASFLIVFILGFGFGILINYTSASSEANGSSTTKYSIRLYDPNYKLISPLLVSDSGAPGNKSLQDQLKLETYDLLNLPDMETISIYYRDIKSNVWAGINENYGFDPGSLLKVPVMIAWYRKAQDNPDILNEKLQFTGSVSDPGGEFSSLNKGEYYTVDYLIRSMITKSDNDAKDVLLANLEPEIINSVFTDLGIQTWGTTNGSSKQISAIIYSRFLRILYNSSYLDNNYSERALGLLSSTTFDSGLRAGVPSSITVAHKFGQFESTNTSPIELGDCGIVYHPQHPYLLCVMTRGTSDVNISTLEGVIRNVSGTVYTAVTNNTLGL